jgi:hypothetical protein
MIADARTTYGVDAQGSRAHWYTGGMSLPEAQRRARSLIRYPGDTATIYRRPESEYVSGPSEPLARYHITHDAAEYWRHALYVDLAPRAYVPRLYRIHRITRTTPERWRVPA